MCYTAKTRKAAGIKAAIMPGRVRDVRLVTGLPTHIRLNKSLYTLNTHHHRDDRPTAVMNVLVSIRAR